MKAAAAVTLAAFLVGCVSLPPPIDQEGGLPSASLPWFPVVAVVDSGINPYHEVFRTEDPAVAAYVSSLRGPDGRSATPVALSREGTLEERLQRDATFWETAQAETLYWFQGTRILATSYSRAPGGPYPVLDEFGHGTAVASVLAQSSPSTIIFSVETEVLNDTTPAEQYAPAARALSAIASVPWIEVVSMSIGPPASLDVPGGNEVARATWNLSAAGKLVIGAAGNQPTHPVTDPFKGPPWVVSVSGARNATHGRTVLAAQTLDVVSDYYWHFALENSTDAMREGGGTSFAAPAVAGVVAEALRELRARGMAMNSGALRDALNATATYWEATDWEPSVEGPDPLDLAESLTTPVVQPWVQMGWGYVGPGQAMAIADAITAGQLPPKPEEARTYMAQQQALRQAYWESRG